MDALQKDTSSIRLVVMSFCEINSSLQLNSDKLTYDNLKYNLKNSNHGERQTVVVSPAASTASSSSSSSQMDSALGASPTTPLSVSSTSSLNNHKNTLIKHSSTTVLRLAFSYTDKMPSYNEKKPLNVYYSNIINIPLERVPIELKKIAQKIANSVLDVSKQIQVKTAQNVILAAASEEIRQILYPLFASAKCSNFSTSNQISENNFEECKKEFEMPKLFHCFLPIEPINLLNKITDFSNIEQKFQIILKNLCKEKNECLFNRMERINQTYVSAVCNDAYVDSSLVIRARGLPWQASDHDIAFFFTGLNIAPGGIALCLSVEGRRNGEALVRFETPKDRNLALRRNRKFLYNRYIEVYRGTGDEFIKIAVGVNSKTLRSVSKDAAMIIRMRGLPFQTTEKQIRDFFAQSSDEEQSDSGIVNNKILFVNKPDGRPSGDAFVFFNNETAGRRALTKHKQRIGSRYVELFRTTQAEVQQIFNRTIKSPQNNPNLITNNGIPKRDCIRLRGLPYEAQVQQIVDFLGAHSRNIVFQGVHMIYNNLGHPSGEAFIQMNSESAAALVAQFMHNKYMELGKKKRYIEVFQCSPEDMNLLLTTSLLQPLNSPTSIAISPSTFPSNLFYQGFIPNKLLPTNYGSPLQNFSQLFAPFATLPFPQQQPQNLLNANSSFPTNIAFPGSTTTNTAINFSANNFCLPTLSITPSIKSSTNLSNNASNNSSQTHITQIQFVQPDGTFQTVNAGNFSNMSQQQFNTKKVASFYAPSFITLQGAIPTSLQVNGNFIEALPYHLPFVTTSGTMKLDPSTNNGLVDISAAAAANANVVAGTSTSHHAVPFTLIHS